MTMLPPGSTIGVLGGGQLGRMLATACKGDRHVRIWKVASGRLAGRCPGDASYPGSRHEPR